jgi:internalin A
VWPEGLLPRFIVRTHALSQTQPRWRSGVILEFEGNRALVKADPQEKTVVISVAGPVERRRRLLAVIRSDFERIHADLSKLSPVAGVPLPDGAAAAVIPYDELCAFEEAGFKEVPRVINGKVTSIDVRKLLNSVELLAVAAPSDSASVFISYSHKDDDLRAELDTHLKLFQRLKLISVWHDRRIAPSDEWKASIDGNLERAEVVLLLVSADFLASDYCYDLEMKKALERHDAGAARVIPIIVRDCKWERAPFARLQVLPRDAKPVRLWPDRDSAWSNVAEGVEQILQAVAKRDRNG